MRAALLFLALPLLAGPALAAVPDMGSGATSATLAQDMDRPELLPRCLADEAAAKVRLESGWDAVPADLAGGCAAAVLDQGPGSYQILAICVEDGLRSAGLPSPFTPTEAP